MIFFICMASVSMRFSDIESIKILLEQTKPVYYSILHYTKYTKYTIVQYGIQYSIVQYTIVY